MLQRILYFTLAIVLLGLAVPSAAHAGPALGPADDGEMVFLPSLTGNLSTAATTGPSATGTEALVSAAAEPDVIASGLNNPRGLAFGPEGALYVAEAGRGGDGPCVPGEFGVDVCYGPSGAITRILDGEQERIATGLSSVASESDGSQAFGPHDISFLGRGGALVTVGACFVPNDNCGQMVHVAASGKWRPIANIGAFEAENNPDGLHDGESNPYAVLNLPGERLATDAAGNTLLRILPNGEISVVAVFPQRDAAAPDGSIVPMDAVPTTVAKGPDGAYYVGELTGFPFPLDDARIYRVVPGEEPEIFAVGFTNVIDIAFDSDGSLLVLEHAKNSIISGDPAGALIRLNSDGSRETVLEDGLVSPTAVAIGEDGAIYISNHGQEAGVGEVLRLVPSP